MLSDPILPMGLQVTVPAKKTSWTSPEMTFLWSVQVGLDTWHAWILQRIVIPRASTLVFRATHHEPSRTRQPRAGYLATHKVLAMDHYKSIFRGIVS